MTRKIGKGDPRVTYREIDGDSPLYIRAQELCLDKAQAIVDHIVAGVETGTTPWKTGRMAKGYKAERYGNGAAVTTDVEYWKYVEFGAQGRVEQPHVRPAYEEVILEGKA